MNVKGMLSHERLDDRKRISCGMLLSLTVLGTIITMLSREVHKAYEEADHFHMLIAGVIEETSGVVTAKEGIIQFVNHRFTDMTGWRNADLEGQPIAKIIPTKYRERHTQEYQNRLRSRISEPFETIIECEVLCEDGTSLPMVLTVNVSADLAIARLTMPESVNVRSMAIENATRQLAHEFRGIQPADVKMLIEQKLETTPQDVKNLIESRFTDTPTDVLNKMSCLEEKLNMILLRLPPFEDTHYIFP